MLRPHRNRFLQILLAAAALGSLSAQPPPGAGAAGSSAPLPPDIQAELDLLLPRPWRPSGLVRTSLGWRDNILLSPFAPISRAFGRVEIETMVWRPMRDRWEFLSFLNGDVLRYFSPPAESGGEQQWSLHAEGRWQPVQPMRLSLKATGYLRDMVIDFSEDETTRVPVPARARGAYLTAVDRITLPGGFWLEPTMQVKRADYRDYPGDYTETRLGGRLQWRRSDALVLSAAWFEHRRRYAERTELSAGGRARPGTHLRFQQRDAEVKAGTAWHAAGDWKLTGTAGRLENRDGASGYFDYNQKRARLELNWERARWRATFDAEAKRFDYLGQTVGTGLAPPTRLAEDYDLRLRAERDLANGWAVFAEHHWERSRSNEAGFSYRANTALAGVQRSF